MGVARFVQVGLKFLLTLLGCVLSPLTNKIFSLLYDGSVTTVPPCEDEILLQSATAIASKIRKKQVKAKDVMERFIARATCLHKTLNCVCADRYAEALAEAEALDAELARDPDNERFTEEKTPFLGVPLSVKEAFGVKGMPNSSGLISRKSFRCDQDCIVVVRLREAGAIPYCMTNVSELCMWYESSNKLYGRSKNPYNTARIVGGSSGGEACNIASGGAVIGIGSDIGGSIRMPAFFNGIFGHRSSRRLVPNEGQFPIATGKDEDLLSTGPMCRYAEDVLPMLKVMAGPNKQADLNKKVDLSKLHVYNILDDGGSLMVSSVDPQLKQAQAKVVEFLQTSMGAKVQTVSIPKFKYSVEMWTAHMTNSGGKSFCDYLADGSTSFSPFKELFKWLFGLSNHTLPAIALGMSEKLDHLLEGPNKIALEGFEKLEKEIGEMLDEKSVIIYPTHPKIAPYHNQPILHPFNWAYTGLFNTLGLPVTQVPLGLSKEGLPLGVQIVGGMNNDRLTIAIAEELASRNVAGWVNPGSSQ